MARKRAKISPPAARAAASRSANGAHHGSPISAPDNHPPRAPATLSRWFSRVADATAHFAGQPGAFLTAAAVVIVWALSGPLFGFSDTWQLVINTSTTIVTFLMVFLIQHTQNRDTLAVQLKLAELIMAVRNAENRLATVEDLSDEELQDLHEQYRAHAQQALDHINRRRTQLKKAS
jgi:low affinity Fe/Cu permease